MTTRALLLRSPWLASLQHCTLPLHAQRRNFFDLPNPTEPQHFAASRLLPYPPKQLYALVSDIDSYRLFIPYCLDSAVTSRCPQSSVPIEADLRVGWGAFDETFRSKVACRLEDLTVEADASENELFEKLLARWEIRAGEEGERGQEGSDVKLGIEFKFANPVYGAMSQAAAPKVAVAIIEAFERRANEVLGWSRGR